ncbi:MAG: DPP IV N-terminal domain-containing protein, partial [Parafilimonas sp.]
MNYRFAFIFLSIFFFSVSYSQQKGYYRNPCIHQNTIIFTAEGDLWKYDINTGLSQRITTNDGLETDPIISPDGKQIVFTGQYEGVSELYIMNIDGGVPKRITYDFGSRYIHACSFTKDGKILYRTSAY